MHIEELRLKQAEFEADRKNINKEYAEIEKLRINFVSRFTIEKIEHLSIEEYVVGQKSRESFCYFLENTLKALGNIHGSNSFKFGVYFGRTREDDVKKYRYVKKFGNDLQEVLKNIKDSLVSLINAGEINDLENIRKNLLSPMFKGKILAVYYPNKYLSVFSVDHLNYFLEKLEIKYSSKDDEISKRGYLLVFKNNDAVMKNWSNYYFWKFLYIKIGRPLKLSKEIPAELKEYAEIDFPDIKEVNYRFIEKILTDVKDNYSKNGDTKFKKIDFDKENRRNRKIGAQGELIVMKAEKEYLAKIGLTDLVPRVKQKSNESDSFGYDILSFDENSEEKFIEVKSTRRKSSNTKVDFFISANELRHAKQIANYYIYIVFEVHSKSPEIFRLKKPFNLQKNIVKITPKNYKVSINLLS